MPVGALPAPLVPNVPAAPLTWAHMIGLADGRQRRPVRVVMLGGAPDTGKSTVARRLPDSPRAAGHGGGRSCAVSRSHRKAARQHPDGPAVSLRRKNLRDQESPGEPPAISR